MQLGDSVRDAAESQDVAGVPAERLTYAGLTLTGASYHATDDEGRLQIPVGPLAREIAIYSVAITPLGHADHRD
ncbi:hypothetical protein [Bradyrhizobium diazoefficiens]